MDWSALDINTQAGNIVAVAGILIAVWLGFSTIRQVSRHRRADQSADLDLIQDQNGRELWAGSANTSGVTLRGRLRNYGPHSARITGATVHICGASRTVQGLEPDSSLKPDDEHPRQFKFTWGLKSEQVSGCGDDLSIDMPNPCRIHFSVLYADGKGRGQEFLRCYSITGDKPLANWQITREDCA